ncbi:MAG: thiolase family protein [Conexivisphaerales archaeon]
MISGFSSCVYKSYPGSTFELMEEAVSKALEMANLSYNDVDGLLATYLPGTFDEKVHLHFFTNQVRQYLGIKARFIDTIDFGGASALAMVYRAYKAVKAGEADTVLCIIGGKASGIRSKGLTVDSLDRYTNDVSLTPFDDFYRIYGDMNPVSDYALVAMRHAKLYGTSDESRAELAVKQRYNAKNNPYALYKNDLSVKDVLSSPLISEPLHLLEIVYPVDGFHCFVVSKRNSPLYKLDILGYGEAHWQAMPPELQDIVQTPAVESSREMAYDLSKVDAFELYDSFTITVMLQIEDIGLVEKGKVAKFVEDKDISYKGEVPINTGGGSLNCGQPAYMSGGIILHEALLQLNSMAQGHQVDGAKKIFLNGIGGWNRSHSVSLILGVRE